MKKFSKLLSIVSSAVLLFTALTGCGGGGGGLIEPTDSNNENSDKVVLRVENWYGGYGDAWLQQVIKQFEADNADFELDGKKGVKVDVKNAKNSGNNILASIENAVEEVFFTESLDYYDYVGKDKYADLTDMVTTPLTEYGETKSIEDKLSPTVKNFFKVNNEKYYAIPFTEAYAGITYDVDLFDRYNFYFKATSENDSGRAYKNAKNEYVFITSKTDKKSYGPDGKTGVVDGVDYSLDDGLPATYEEFYALCDKMLANTPKITPIIWPSLDGYVGSLLSALVADYEGLDNMMVNYTFDGTANVITNISDLVSGSATEPTIQNVEIKNKNGYDVYRQAGKYYALQFVSTLINKGYASEKSYTDSHVQAQSHYVYGSYYEDTKNERVAMLAEGTWWENEADSVFSQMAAARGQDALRKNRKFAYMPLPKATEDKIGEKQTRVALNNTAIFINNNIKSAKKMELCKSFVRMVLSDKWLSNFSAVESAPMLYNYDVKTEDYNKMTNFGQTVQYFRQTGDVAYPQSQSSMYLSSPTYFDFVHKFWNSTVDGLDYLFPTDGLHKGTFGYAKYFEGMYNYRKNSWDTFSKYFD